MTRFHRNPRTRGGRAIALLMLVACTGVARAQDAPGCAPAVARVVSIEGAVEVRRAGQSQWQAVSASSVGLCGGDGVHVAARSRAAITLQPETTIRLDQFTTVTLTVRPDETVVELHLDDRVAPAARGRSCGAGYFTSRFPRRFRVLTPFVNATVEGTEFEVALACTAARVSVFEGKVLAEAPAGKARLDPGHSVGASASGMGSVSVAARPVDAVAWAIHYPRLADRPAAPAEDCAGLAPPSREACEMDRSEALLGVGRIDEARAVLEASAGSSAEVLALRAVIAVARNERDDALGLARRAVGLAPRSLRALLALSYAEQAGFDIDAALGAARRAADAHPASALARARVAELLLSVGKSREAEAAAQAAIAADPKEPRGHLVAGFALLASARTAAAREAFALAADLAPGDPLPRLGLGLALIRDGRLTEGREQFEIAVALDPVDSLVRSYMGKAYFDERDRGRIALAGIQFDAAKTLDPNDPTPWFYDAIRKHATNRPGEALMDLTRSVELNDNRAVYRSRLLLDEDQSARAASQARISSELGFDQLAQAQSSRAISFDPGGFPAHRNLAESYLLLPRYESARVSEVLQSQMLQPVTAVPFSPRLSETRAPILENEGPVTPSFQEFNPLLERDRAAFYLSGFAGTDRTFGDELMAAFVRGRHGLRLGQYHAQTDGFRPNNDLAQYIRTLYYQFDLDDRNSLQAEYRNTSIANGDVRLNFDPGNYSTNRRDALATELYRAGFRHSENASAHWLAALTRQRRNSQLDDLSYSATGFGAPFDLAYQSTRDRVESDAYTAELQHLRDLDRVHVAAGMGATRISKSVDTSGVGGIVGDPFFDTPFGDQYRTTPEHYNGYAYFSWRVSSAAQLVTALSYDHYNDLAFDKERWNPKLGVVWNLGAATTVRVAAIQTLKRPFAATQTLEPTQVAGFNQFFDDVDGTDAKRFAGAIDHRFGERWFAGVELSGRALEVPVTTTTGTLARVEDREERLYRAFVSGLVTREFGVSAEYSYDDQRRNIPDSLVDAFPHRVTTQLAPLRASWYLANGVFVRGTLTLVDQSIDTAAGGALDRSRHRFSITDLMLGYRLPDGRGILSLEARNLFDREFGFQDTDFSGIPRMPLFRPGRMLMLRATFQY
jgi:Flp pilus assembly protein TadD